MAFEAAVQSQQGKAPGKKPETPNRNPDQLALNQAELAIKRSYILQSYAGQDASTVGSCWVKNMATLQKLDDNCKVLKAYLDPGSVSNDRNAALYGGLRAVDIKARLDQSKPKNLSKEQKAADDDVFSGALQEYKGSLDAVLERLSVASKQNGNPYPVYEAAKERYDKIQSSAAPTSTDHTGPTGPADPKRLEAAEKALLEAGAKLLAFDMVFGKRAQADVKKAADAILIKFGF